MCQLIFNFAACIIMLSVQLNSILGRRLPPLSTYSSNTSKSARLTAPVKSSVRDAASTYSQRARQHFSESSEKYVQSQSKQIKGEGGHRPGIGSMGSTWVRLD